MAEAKRRFFGSRAPKAAPYNRRRAITASAIRLDPTNRRDMQELANQSVRMLWQENAWQYYDRIGEVKYAYTLISSLFSRLRIFPAVVLDPTEPPVPLTDGTTIERTDEEKEDPDAPPKPNNGLTPQEAVDVRDVFESEFRTTNLPVMQRAYSLNMNVPGECYFVKWRGRWEAKSTSELRVDTSGVPKMQRSFSSLPIDLPSDTPIGRVWRNHPRYSYEPDSAMRSMLEECAELLLLSQVIRSNSRARLNAGILYVSDEVSVASTTVTDDQEIQEDEEADFEKQLYDALTGPIANEDNPNTVVPLLLRGPASDGASKHIEHILMERKTDEFLVQRSEKVLDRILQGLEVPKEAVSGYAGVKFANSVHVDENMYKAHIEPLALSFVDAMVDIILRPALKDRGWSDERIAKATIWYDPSEIVTRPDRASDAQSLYDRKELSGAALRDAFGFSDGDAPDENELASRLALASIVPPEVVQILLTKIMPNVLGKHLAAGQGAPGSLPESLQNALDGTDTPSAAPPDLGTSAPDQPAPESGGTAPATDTSAPADQWQQAPASVSAQ